MRRVSGLATKEVNVWLWPPKKSWMPAFAGMTGEGAGGGRRTFIRDFNRMRYTKQELLALAFSQ